MELTRAREIATAICYQLHPECELIRIAGSIRRNKAEVKDIEIVALPRHGSIVTTDLFMNHAQVTPVTEKFIQIVNNLGVIIKGQPTGKYMALELPEGINLDLFMPDDFDYYRQFVIRTGSADWVTKNIAAGWRRKGWCGSDRGLRLMSDCLETKGPDGKSKWKCINPNSCSLPPHWRSEQEFFIWLGIPYVEPFNRVV